MVIWSETRMWQYRDQDHREDPPHFLGHAQTDLNETSGVYTVDP